MVEWRFAREAALAPWRNPASAGEQALDDQPFARFAAAEDGWHRGEDEQEQRGNRREARDVERADGRDLPRRGRRGLNAPDMLASRPVVKGGRLGDESIGPAASSLIVPPASAARRTVRKTTDVRIGTYCFARQLPLLYADADFEPMTRYLGLRLPERPR